MNIAQVLAQATARMAASNDSARADAEILLAQVLDISRGAFYAKAEDEVSADCVAKFLEHTDRRVRGEPVAYITGEQGFWSLNLRVTSDVLIPRPETELLVEWGLESLEDFSCPHPRGTSSRQKPRVADLGTGSGAIALALATEIPDAQVIAVDVSQAALEVARNNAELQRTGNVQFVRSDFAEFFDSGRNGEAFDLIVSNPPYVAEGDPHLAALAFEPGLALTAGRDGLDSLRVIVARAPQALNSGGWLLLEHGFDQGEAVRALLQQAGLQDVQTRRDLAGHERATGGHKL